jgi:uncharacterized membrane protein
MRHLQRATLLRNCTFALAGFLYTVLSLQLPIWVDEAFTIQQSSLSTSLLIQDSLHKFDAVHFVYYFLCSIIGYFFNDSLYALRILSVLATLGTLKNDYSITALKVNSSAAQIATVVLGFLPVTVDFATQARSTSLVTFLYSYAIWNVIAKRKKFKTKNLLAILSITSLFLSISIVSAIGYVVLVSYAIREKREFFSHWTRKSLFILPILFAAPIFLLAFTQKSQIAWIEGHSQESEILQRLVFWPFLESERTLEGINLLVAIGVTAIVSLIIVFSLRTAHDIRFVFFSLILTVIPSAILFLFSVLQPIFLTRYFTYSAIGYSIVLSLFWINCQNPSLRIAVAVIFVFFCVGNIAQMTDKRDGETNWKVVSRDFSKGPQDSSIILEPDWSTPLAKYHFKLPNDSRIISESDLLERIGESNCLNLPRFVWFISSFEERNSFNSGVMDKIGYRKVLNVGGASHSLFSRNSCKLE